MSKDPKKVPTWRVSWSNRGSLNVQDGQRDVVASNVVEALEECQPLPLDAQQATISILSVPEGWAWTPKCVYGDHEMQLRCPMAPRGPLEDDMPCDPCPVCDTKDPNFASLLEREPLEPDVWREDMQQKWEDAVKRNLTLRATNDSQAVRIKSLEGVLVAIRTGVATILACPNGQWNEEVRMRNAALRHIQDLIGETLDPCKPWCVRDEPGHQGACEPQERSE